MELDHISDEDKLKAFQQALGKCRTCGHTMVAHYRNPKVPCLEAILTNEGENKPCKCVLFIPQDNLEFLEWAAQQKEKKS
jgi:hypothetical protein